MTECPGCGVRLPESGYPLNESYLASGECLEVCHEVYGYTLAHAHPSFLHQHVVDAYAVQHKSESAARIGVAFGLIGLYLACEKGYTGRQVQLAHMELGRVKREWPRFERPAAGFAGLTVVDVWLAEEGTARDETILRWARAVWESWGAAQGWTRQTCAALLVRLD